MDEFFKYYFTMFDKILEKNYNGRTNDKFDSLVKDTSEALKTTFRESTDYHNICLTIDKYFDSYIESKQA